MSYYNKCMTDEQFAEFIQILLNNTMYEVITGSKSYGVDNEFSDEDVKMMSCLPKEWLFSLGEEWETTTSYKPDFEIHSPKKIITLLNKQNPTALEMVYTEERFIKKESKYSRLLRKYRDLFLSQQCFEAYGGYATQQLMRIKAGMDKVTENDKNKHLLSTLNRLITTFSTNYNAYTNGGIIINRVYMEDSGKQFADVGIHFDSIPMHQLSGMVSEMTNTMKTYNKVNNRNKKPAEKLSKHAMHLIRILINGIEALENGIINVYMHKHREFLLDVRNEKYTWEQIFEIVEELEVRLNQAKQKTILPPSTDFAKINAIYQEIMYEWMTAA
jgi:predicted nucleotidyltransferase